MERIVFGAGCFWGVQHYFDSVPGVAKTTVGYGGGMTKNPSYEQVCSGVTGHAEVVEVVFDPHKVAVDELIRHFFRIHNPTQLNRQGPDVGSQYRSAIFYTKAEQKEAVERIMGELASVYEEPIVTELVPAGDFYPAEEYHQKFTEKTGRGGCHIDYEPIS